MTYTIVKRLSVLLLMGATVFVSPTQAHGQATPTNDDINIRWDRANTLYDRGDYNAALAEYLEVHKRKPLAVVYYNLGRTEEKLGHLVEALDWLEKCLANPGGLDANRREYTQKLVDDLRARIGLVQVTTNIEGAIVELDHREVGKAPQEIRVASGVHIISVTMAGYAVVRKEIKIAGGIKEHVHLDLIPATIASSRLTISSELMDADVFIDGQSVGQTPILGSIKVDAAEHKIVVTRAGYQSFERTLKCSDGDTLPVVVTLDEDPSWIAANGGYLQLDFSEEHAMVKLDGLSRGQYRGSLRLAPGRHRLRAERGGFAAVERDVMVTAGKTTREKVVFEPNPDTLVKLREEYAIRRRWGVVATSTGVVGIIASGVALIAVDQMAESNNCGTPRQKPFCNDYLGRLGVAGGFMALSTVTAGVGVWLLNARADIYRYEKKQWKPTVVVGSEGFQLGLAGSF